MVKRPFLGIVPLGPIDPDILRTLRTALSKFLLLPVRVLHPQPMPQHTYHLIRHQYNAVQLLEFLLDQKENQAFRILGVTAADLYIPIFTFIFGEAQLSGKTAIISVFRPRGDAGGPAPLRQIFLTRLLKLSLHELGHTFGLKHCLEDGCLMAFSSNLEKLDQQKLALCQYCQILLQDYFKDQGLPLPLLKRNAEIHAPDAPTPIPDNSHKHRQ
jgi:archaemetzincin